MDKIIEKRLKEFIETFEDSVLDYIDDEADYESTIEEIYYSGLNHNNADETSGIIYTKEMIKSLLDLVPSNIHKWYEGRCKVCGTTVGDYHIEYNRVPYGDSYADEPITTGYTCDYCGHSEEF